MTNVEKTNGWTPSSNVGLSDTMTLTLMVLTPAVSLVSYWTLGEIGLVATALGLPLLAGANVLFTRIGPSARKNRLQSGGHTAEAFHALTNDLMTSAREEGKKSSVFLISIDELDAMSAHHGTAAMDSVANEMLARLRSAVRQGDVVGVLETGRFGLTLNPQNTLDLEICLELAGRLARTLNEPYSLDGTSIYLTVSIGFCQLGRERSQSPNNGVDPVTACAVQALEQACAAAPNAIRAYTHRPALPKTADNALDLSASEALDKGEFVAWFQPQISTDTGKLTGFEALARWIHPTRGPVSPAEFLPQLETANRMARLSEVMIYNTFTALRAWDQAGVDVAQVGVNFSMVELSDPALVDKISWELDRFELGANRLVVEVLETVVSHGPDDVITRNIKGLRELGCHIDLDDFGTGHASLASIQRFDVNRIKIDRSFVMKSDRDLEQQRMIRAILTMAEKLDLETVAEGVETVGEHSLLAQLGCTHVQGYGIGRPMPFEQTLDWIRDHEAKLQTPPDIGRAVG